MFTTHYHTTFQNYAGIAIMPTLRITVNIFKRKILLHVIYLIRKQKTKEDLRKVCFPHLIHAFDRIRETEK